LEEGVFACGMAYMFLGNAWYRLGKIDVGEFFRGAA